MEDINKKNHIMFQIFRDKIIIIFGILIVTLSYLLIINENIKYLVLIAICVGSLVLYKWYVEAFIMLLLVANDEIFYLLPREYMGTANYQDLIILVCAVTGIFYFFFESKPKQMEFKNVIIAMYGMVIIGILTAYFGGQPIILGVKAAKGFYLGLFYFILFAKQIKISRLFNIIIVTAVLLTFLNNIQYLLWGSMKIFYYERELERAGVLRFMVGGFFVIYAALIAFGEYLKTKKLIYLFVSIYMILTMIIQSQIRAIMLGFIVTLPVLWYLVNRKSKLKVILVSSLLIVIAISTVPLIEQTFIGKIISITQYEFTEKGGTVGARIDSYEYYFNEIAKSPLIGRGIWNDVYTYGNPQDMKHVGIHLSDIGGVGFLFHFGLIGIIWVITVFRKIYLYVFLPGGMLRGNMHYGYLAYFIFSMVTIATLNGLFERRTIIYFAITLCFMEQDYILNSKKETYYD